MILARPHNWPEPIAGDPDLADLLHDEGYPRDTPVRIDYLGKLEGVHDASWDLVVGWEITPLEEES